MPGVKCDVTVDWYVNFSSEKTVGLGILMNGIFKQTKMQELQS